MKRLALGISSLLLPAIASAHVNGELAGGVRFFDTDSVPTAPAVMVGIDLSAKLVIRRELVVGGALSTENSSTYGAGLIGVRLGRGDENLDLLGEAGVHAMSADDGASDDLPFIGARTDLVLHHANMFVSFTAELRGDVGAETVRTPYDYCPNDVSDGGFSLWCGSLFSPADATGTHTDRFGGMSFAGGMSVGVRL